MKVCAEPGCPTLTPTTRCPTHTKQRQNTSRKQYDRGTYGSEWPAISKRYRRHHPTCECTDPNCRCNGTCTQPSAETDHIIPLRHFTNRQAAHQDDNLQALCKACHSRKTSLEVIHTPTPRG